MTAPMLLTSLTGTWQGPSRLWLDPEEPAHETESTAEISLLAQGQFARIAYRWTEAGDPQDGLLVIGENAPAGRVKAFWIDSFHTNSEFMVFEGTVQPQGAILVKASYAAPPGPDWGWQIAITAEDGGKFQIRMHNISPKGEEFLAVETLYNR